MHDEFSSPAKRERPPILIWSLFTVILLLFAVLLGSVAVVIFAPESEAAQLVWRVANSHLGPVTPHYGEFRELA